jgi:nitrogen fixation NifU-like protein
LIAAPGDLQALYRDTVLDHSRHPRNFRKMPDPDRRAEGHNPLCGDKLTLYVALRDDMIGDASFEGTGCAISIASASMLTEMVRGKSVTEARATIDGITGLFTHGEHTPIPDGYGALVALAGVRAYPSRVRCATLPGQTLRAALAKDVSTVSTESPRGQNVRPE